jgi:catechol 2,3-dioxygenase-like lactoylglutathione lyase family enzyme
MLSHVSIGVKDLAKSRSFYDAALKPLGYKCVAEGSGYVYYGVKSPDLTAIGQNRPGTRPRVRAVLSDQRASLTP